MSTATQRTETSIQATAEAARRTVEQAERALRTAALEGAYAYVGVADAAVGAVRTLPEVAQRLRADLRTELPAVPARVGERVRTLLGALETELDALAVRGRGVVERVAADGAPKRAVEQARTAQAQVRAAASSLRRAGATVPDAVEEAVEEIGA